MLDVAQELLSNHALTLLNAHSIFQRRAARYVASLATDINQLRKHMKEPEKLMGNFGLSRQEMNWLTFQGYDTNLKAVQDATTQLQASSLLMWSGIYHSTITDLTIQIQGGAPPAISQVWKLRVKKPSFSNYTLSWSVSDGNPSSASLVFKMDDKTGVLSFAGKFWKTGDDDISGQNAPSKSSLSNYVSMYKTVLN